MSKPLSKKLQDYIMDMAIKYLPFGGRKWDSSAQNLENILKYKGINKKLFYTYKLPYDMSPQDFQDKITMEYFCGQFYTCFASKVFHDKSLNISEKLQLARYVWEMRRNKNHKNMKFYVDEIKRKNPELSDINPKNSDTNLVYGTLFGFAPAEIKYFCEVSGLRDFDKEQELDSKLESLGVRTNYILAPETSNAIMAALQQQKG